MISSEFFCAADAVHDPEVLLGGLQSVFHGADRTLVQLQRFIDMTAHPAHRRLPTSQKDLSTLMERSDERFIGFDALFEKE